MKKLHTLRNRFTFLFFICFLFSIDMQAQLATGITPPASINKVTQCGSKIMLDQTDPAMLQSFEQSMYAKALDRSAGRTGTDTQRYTLPVVFHIIHENGPENISDGDIWDAMSVLNAAFKHAPPFNPAGGVDINIDFCLSASAITRSASPLTDLVMETGNAGLKTIDRWDPNSYINIWVVSSISSTTMGPGVAGYSTMPPSHGTLDDGIVVEAGYINSHPEDVAVLVHEMGHYLGLYHTFEGGCGNSDCMMNGDRVCDTPPDNSTAPVNCAGTANTCHSDSDDASINNPFRSVALGGLGDQPDMFQNFMDYGFQTCQNKFTEGQRSRMRDALISSRHSLLEHPGICVGCATPIVASLTIPDTLPAGVPATFDIITSSTGLIYLWQFNGNIVVGGASITQTFPVGGLVLIDIYVIDPSSSSCSMHMYDTVYFKCDVPQPLLSASPAGLLNPGETVIFTTPDNGYTYSWNVDGVSAGSGTTFNYVAGSLGQTITLEASDGTCKAVSETYFADPGNCANSKQNNVWYFGENAGINFNVSPPQAITGRITTGEGSSVLCDDNGVPLFYSDGTTVGNSQTGNTLLNGSGLTGNPTTTQSALFVPMPGSNRYVYLFTVDFQATEGLHGGGIFYSIIDKQGNGGQGEVTTKNQLLLAPVTEKVTAVRNTSGNGIWLIAHKYGSDAFYSWPITAAGGIGGPVISHTGSIHTSPPGALPGYYTIGEMKTSPSGNKIAVAISGLNRFEVFDFNKSTGVLSNAATLGGSSITNKTYGIAFSPNERFLYGTYTSSPYTIIRYDLTAGSAAAIDASGTIIGICGGAVQLAPDGKIYGARGGQNYLAVISNPNAVNPADCGYVTDGFKLAPGTFSQLGLINPVQSTVASIKPEITGPDKVCLTGSSQVINYIIYPIGRATYNWIHHGPNAFTFVNDSSVTVTYSSAGVDTLVVQRISGCGTFSDTLVIRSGFVPAFNIGSDQLVCKGTAVTLDAGPGMFDYRWNNGSRNQTNPVTTAGQISVQVTTTAGCILRDTMLITNYTLPSLNLGRDTSICTAETITLTAPAGMDSYLWSTGATGNSIIAADSGRYIVTVGKFGCLFKDTIRIQKNVPLNVISNDTLRICNTTATTIYTAASGFDSYSWQLPSGDVITTPSVTIDGGGYYILTYSNHCGTGIDSLYNFVPHIFATDTIVSCDDTLHLVSDLPLFNFIYGSNDYVGHTQNGDSVAIFRSGYYIALSLYPNAPPGCYIIQTLYALVDTALVRPSMPIDLGPDTSYCEGGVLSLNAGSGFDWYRWNTGSIDSATTVYGFGEYTVNAHYCGFDYTDTIVISNNNSVTVDLGPDVSSCNPTAVILDAGNGYDWYEWNNGAHTQQINGSSFGQYSVSAGLNGCIARDTVMIIDCTTAIPEKTDDCTQPFYLSPNPGIDVVTLGSGCSEITDVRVTISSSAGKILGEKEGSLSAVNVFMNQLMQHLSPAVYVIRVTNKNDSYYFKWMIIK